ncbi:hypothetical protein BDY21DRAFT_396921, partial [Lineolata rhizophorae]
MTALSSPHLAARAHPHLSRFQANLPVSTDPSTPHVLPSLIHPSINPSHLRRPRNRRVRMRLPAALLLRRRPHAPGRTIRAAARGIAAVARVVDARHALVRTAPAGEAGAGEAHAHAGAVGGEAAGPGVVDAGEGRERGRGVRRRRAGGRGGGRRLRAGLAEEAAAAGVGGEGGWGWDGGGVGGGEGRGEEEEGGGGEVH